MQFDLVINVPTVITIASTCLAFIAAWVNLNRDVKDLRDDFTEHVKEDRDAFHRRDENFEKHKIRVYEMLDQIKGSIEIVKDRVSDLAVKIAEKK